MKSSAFDHNLRRSLCAQRICFCDTTLFGTRCPTIETQTHLSRPLFAQHRRHGFQSIRGCHASRHIVSPKHVDRLPRLLFLRYLHRNMFVAATRGRWRWWRYWFDYLFRSAIDGVDFHWLLTHCMCSEELWIAITTLAPDRDFQSRMPLEISSSCRNDEC
jgi:hypothetical protein